MSKVLIMAFHPANERRTVICGEEFEVELSLMASPLHEGGDDEVRFASTIGGCDIQPTSMPVVVEPMENRVTKHFRMSIRCSSTEMAEVIARTANSGSADSFVLRVLCEDA